MPQALYLRFHSIRSSALVYRVRLHGLELYLYAPPDEESVIKLLRVAVEHVQSKSSMQRRESEAEAEILATLEELGIGLVLFSPLAQDVQHDVQIGHSRRSVSA